MEKTPWAHLDIAGTGMGSPSSDINQSWGSGWGVRLLDRLGKDYYEGGVSSRSGPLKHAIPGFRLGSRKARSNAAKHGVRFEEAMTVLRDPLSLTIFDEAHSVNEERWITLGLANSERLLVVVHTFDERDDQVYIRIISARIATSREQRQYRESPST